MSAEIIILPVIRLERPGGGPSLNALRVTLSNRDVARLRRISSGWEVSLEQAASDILAGALDPKRHK